MRSASGIRPGPNVVRHVEQSLTAVAHAPWSEAEKQIILAVADDFVCGSALRSIDEFVLEDDFIKAQIETGEIPHLQRAMANGLGPPTSAANSDSANLNQFEFGLAALLDGIEQRIKAGTFSDVPQPVVPRTTPVPAVKRASTPTCKRT